MTVSAVLFKTVPSRNFDVSALLPDAINVSLGSPGPYSI